MPRKPVKVPAKGRKKITASRKCSMRQKINSEYLLVFKDAARTKTHECKQELCFQGTAA